jgi:enoyl-CoA hydratase/carnithine racemase
MSKRVEIKIENHVAVVTLSRPEKMNALDQAMFDAIIEAGETLAKDASVRAVVLTGAGKAFCAGLDLSSLSPQGVGSTPLADRTHGVANMWQKAAWTWRELPVPVIAAVHGVAFGGGLQILSGTDIKYITASTKLSIMEMKWGIIPDMAGTQLWRHNVRDDIIRELTYTHRVFSGEEAVKYGFATHVSENPLEDAMKLATEIASKSPSAIVKAKEMLNEAPYLNAEDGLMSESNLQQEIIGKKNQMEAVFSGMQKRAGNFHDFR